MPPDSSPSRYRDDPQKEFNPIQTYALGRDISDYLNRYPGQALEIEFDQTVLKIGPPALQEIAEELSRPETQTRADRMVHTPGGIPPHIWVIGSVLVDKTAIGGDLAPLATRALWQRLQFIKTNEPAKKKEPEPPKNVLTYEQLDRAMLLSQNKETGSVATQLGDSLCRDIIVQPVRDPARDSDSRGSALLTEYLGILESLKHTESAKVLREWIFSQLSTGDPTTQEASTTFLTRLVQFTLVIDDRDFVSIYASGNKLPLLPFQTLYTAITSSMALAFETKGYEPWGARLEQIKKLIELRFYQISVGQLSGVESIEATERFHPATKDLADACTAWVSECRTKHGISDAQAALQIVKWLEQLNMQKEAADLYSFIANKDPLLASEIRLAAERYGLMQADLKSALRDLLRTFKEHPFSDIYKTDLSGLIREDTERVEIYYVTGTFGPFTKGHLDFIDRIEAYIRYLESLDPEDAHIQRFIVIAPIPNVAKVKDKYPKEYKKEPTVAGTLYQRLGSAMIALAGRNVYFTTQLHSDPDTALNITKSVNAAENRFRQKLTADLDRIHRPPGIDVKFIPCVGSDELQYAGRDEDIGHRSLVKEQPVRLRDKESLIVARGNTLELIRNLGSIARLTKASVLIPPWLPYIGSTATITEIGQMHFTQLVNTQIPFCYPLWSHQEIQRRTDNFVRSEPLAPTLSIFNRLRAQLRLTRDNL